MWSDIVPGAICLHKEGFPLLTVGSWNLKLLPNFLEITATNEACSSVRPQLLERRMDLGGGLSPGWSQSSIDVE